ncbi:hypothetical protein [Rhizobium indigoferae]|uniref:DUF982 domain-containing protein n=1 Tax=Rhizobium indigoferae TaxID=158891 RepID=A0ABZ1DWQ6_9HYPH|nr:hypothetical protein [Rhizobium indigoferae]WRW39812.1 hypothetical protein U5G49_005166 [Rhizobium indigoferae]GLR55500.1 hypothetical protein GCM10007919_02220 [Rhizobium indigoferae]
MSLRLSVNNLQFKEPKSCKMLKGHDEWIAGKLDPADLIENARTIVIAAEHWRHADELVPSVRLSKCADLLVRARGAIPGAGSLN